MATIEQIRDAMHRQPFLGFTIHLTDGRSYHIKHPDFIAVPDTARGRDLMIHDRGTHRVDILRVVEVDEPPEPESNGEGNGGPKKVPPRSPRRRRP